MAKTSLVYPLDIERYSGYDKGVAGGAPTPPTTDQPLDYGKELIDMKNTIEATKVCAKCGEDKPLSEYSKRKSSKDGLNYYCKSCVKAANKAHYEANREKVLASNEAYREANREKILADKKAYREANREKLLAANKAYRDERWANDPEFRERFAAKALRRRRLLKDAKQEPYLREDIFERDNWTCGLCQEPIDPELKWPESESASIDHILPVSLGGDDTPANVQAAHLGCNSGKSNRVELELEEAA